MFSVDWCIETAKSVNDRASLNQRPFTQTSAGFGRYGAESVKSNQTFFFKKKQIVNKVAFVLVSVFSLASIASLWSLASKGRNKSKTSSIPIESKANLSGNVKTLFFFFLSYFWFEQNSLSQNMNNLRLVSDNSTIFHYHLSKMSPNQAHLSQSIFLCNFLKKSYSLNTKSLNLN